MDSTFVLVAPGAFADLLTNPEKKLFPQINTRMFILLDLVIIAAN